MKLSESSAAIVLKSIDLNKDIHFFETLGFRILSIFPADQPRIAELNGHGLRIKLDRSAKNVNAEIQIKPNQPSQFDKTEYTSPTGTAIQIVSDQQKISETTAKTIVVSSPEKDGWHVGRAGMLYRDLIPDRLNGRIIASHIRIPEGGPVPDRVHYHTVDFQLIYCLSGWVKVVYEDQGDPLILETGDFVTQPPEIRHRVLESSENLNVLEIGLPAEHLTSFDYELNLPTATVNPERKFSGQRFYHFQRKAANWNKISEDSDVIETNLLAYSAVGDLKIFRFKSSESELIEKPNGTAFYFIRDGKATVQTQSQIIELKKNNAITIPKTVAYQLFCSAETELIQLCF